MSTTKKTDNLSLASKIGLRRWLGRERKPPDCLDSGECERPRASRLHVAAGPLSNRDMFAHGLPDFAEAGAGVEDVHLMDAQAPEYNVIDIDPFGEPWDPYHELLVHLARPVAVFLTHGHVMQSQVSTVNLEAVGLPPDWPIPRTPSLSAYVAQRMLEETWRFATIAHAGVIRFPRVTYYALALEPLNAAKKKVKRDG